MGFLLKGMIFTYTLFSYHLIMAHCQLRKTPLNIFNNYNNIPKYILCVWMWMLYHTVDNDFNDTIIAQFLKSAEMQLLNAMMFL